MRKSVKRDGYLFKNWEETRQNGLKKKMKF